MKSSADAVDVGPPLDRVEAAGLRRRELMALAGTAVPVALAGCTGALNLGAGNDTTTVADTPLPGTLTLSAEQGFVGDTLTFAGSGLPAGTPVEVVWKTVQGRWALIKHMNIVGPTYAPRTVTVASPTTDANGSFSTSWTIPEDYGGSHEVVVQAADGTPLAKASFTLLASFELDRTSAPLGETFTVASHALGPDQFHTNYQVAWDNGQTGLFTAVSSRGHSTAEIRATGPTGQHVLEVFRGYLGDPFLVAPQSPFGPVIGGRKHAWLVEVTEPTGSLQTQWSDPLRPAKPDPVFYPALDKQTDARLAVTPDMGVTGDEITITGAAFPANTTVDLVWYTISGSRVTSAPIEKVPLPGALPSAKTDANGSFELTATVPSDKGGTRPVVAVVNGKSVAVAGFLLEPKVVGLSTEQGPVGTEFDVTVSGIGWTEYGNSYALTYDNKYLGYGCGMDERGGENIFTLHATGAPGPHFIDIFPAMYRADTNPPDMYEGKAQLTFRQDHPGHPTPSLHFVFTVTE